MLTFVVSISPIFLLRETTAGAKADLFCEMNDYIRPDSEFRWRRGSQLISANDKYGIEYCDGLPMRAQNGGSSLAPSRFSTLTIFLVEESDEGTYTCFVEGSDASADVQLIVNEG